MSREILDQLKQKQCLIVNARRKNGLILIKTYHAEFAGPGAVVGSEFDVDVKDFIPVGKLSLTSPENIQERKKAYLIRRQWVKLTKQITDNPVPIQRAQVILNQFDNWFDAKTTAQLPDEAFALLVGVLPQTIRHIRQMNYVKF
ncbi:MAG: hypothetical protein AB4041_22110 [Microcystaceae cyanobacterium]